MKAFVLMNQRTGILSEGYRITFMDQVGINTNDVPHPFGYEIQMCVVEQHGWIVFHPEMSPFGIFLNLKAVKIFKNLGEL